MDTKYYTRDTSNLLNTKNQHQNTPPWGLELLPMNLFFVFQNSSRILRTSWVTLCLYCFIFHCIFSYLIVWWETPTILSSQIIWNTKVGCNILHMGKKYNPYNLPSRPMWLHHCRTPVNLMHHCWQPSDHHHMREISQHIHPPDICEKISISPNWNF